MNNVTQAIAQRDRNDQLIGWLRQQQTDIAMAAVTHIKPATIIRVTQGALRRNPKLLQAAVANPVSLLSALLDCARLGHEPDTDQYYLVPYGNEVQGIEGYKGIIERMFRAGQVSAVVAEIVHQGDVYRSRGSTSPPLHEYDDFADPYDRGPLRGAYAYAVMLDGRCSQVIRMGKAEIERHQAMSKGAGKEDSPWQRWPESMWKKCPLRGLEPYVPTSSEWRRPAGENAPVYTLPPPVENPVDSALTGQSAPVDNVTKRGPSRAPSRDRHDVSVKGTQNPEDQTSYPQPLPASRPASNETFDDAKPVENIELPASTPASNHLEEDEDGVKAPPAMLRQLHALFGLAGWKQDKRPQRIAATSNLIGKPITSFNDLTREMADTAIGYLNALNKRTPDKHAYADALEAIAAGK